MMRYTCSQNQLTRTVVLEVFNTVALKYWTVDRFIHWLIKNCTSVGRRRSWGLGICPLSSSPLRGIQTAYVSSPRGICPFIEKNANARGLALGGDGHGWNWLTRMPQYESMKTWWVSNMGICGDVYRLRLKKESHIPEASLSFNGSLECRGVTCEAVYL